MKHLFALFLAFLLTTSCVESPDPEGIMIRLENSSNVEFKEVLVNSGSGNVLFDNIKAGQKSKYKEFESAYRYGFVSLKANGKELRIQPFDYVGETPLEKGYYTYKIGINNSDQDNPTLTLELVIDD
ncbi:hypothetical protein LZF95_15635 [Algoriphagus sp. AGSA1]|uniref:hypothetical protein n=1 Tax=Algoriphagus sp. AGSA1 TaxID=2907213 RepID=UPI001F48C625|nr:hypothetical protein [Algoriphagus sp. AGSA1]MCE7056114.1 hypothetical protein [Algoriphagus sp. AGSA1]